MIMLSGMVVNNAIIFLDQLNITRRGGADIHTAVMESSMKRLRPILMTSLSTIFGFMPLAFGWGQSSELWAPLAVIVMGGMFTSTFLMLFILPNLYIALDDIGKIWSHFRQKSRTV